MCEAEQNIREGTWFKTEKSLSGQQWSIVKMTVRHCFSSGLLSATEALQSSPPLRILHHHHHHHHYNHHHRHHHHHHHQHHHHHRNHPQVTFMEFRLGRFLSPHVAGCPDGGMLIQEGRGQVTMIMMMVMMMKVVMVVMVMLVMILIMMVILMKKNMPGASSWQWFWYRPPLWQ